MRGTDGYLYLKDIIVSKNRPPEAVIEFKYMSATGKVRKKTQRFSGSVAKVGVRPGSEGGGLAAA